MEGYKERICVVQGWMGSGDLGEISLQSLEVEVFGFGVVYFICVFVILEGNREGVREQQIQKGNRVENIYKFKIRFKWNIEKSLRWGE